MTLVYDTWRAVLALVVGILLLEAAGLRNRGDVVVQRQPAPAAMLPASWPVAGGGWPPAQPVALQPWPPAQHWPAMQANVVQAPERPLHRVGGAVVELAESVLGVVR